MPRAALGLLVLLAGAAGPGAADALECGVPVPVRLEGEVAVLLVPPGWMPGDRAAVLAEGSAFREGCGDPVAAALLEGGVMVLALAPPAAAPVLAPALRMLREGYGAGEVAALVAASLLR